MFSDFLQMKKTVRLSCLAFIVNCIMIEEGPLVQLSRSGIVSAATVAVNNTVVASPGELPIFLFQCKSFSFDRTQERRKVL